MTKMGYEKLMQNNSTLMLFDALTNWDVSTFNYNQEMVKNQNQIKL